MKLNIKLSVIACCLSASAIAAIADEPQSEWRVLGPAYSKHFGNDGAAVTKAGSSTQECKSMYEHRSSQFVSTTLLAGPFSVIGRDESGNYIYATHPAYIQACETVVVPDERGWHGNNPSIGLELTQRFEKYSNKFLASYVSDSYGSPSVMLAAGRLWPMFDFGSVKVDAGLVGGLWYRTVLSSDDLVVRRLVPFVLPSMSITDEYTGLGLNVGLAPRLSVHGYTANRTTTLMLQATYKVRDSKNGWTFLRLGATGGEVTASVEYEF